MMRASELRSNLKESFYPHVEARGFVRGKATSIFTPFRRIRDSKIHVFDVQWDKSGKPRFVLNFGEASSAGVDIQGEHIGPEKIETFHCRVGRVVRRRGGSMGTWFQLRKPLAVAVMTFSLDYEPQFVVRQAIDAFAELEAWWATKHEGPHIYIWNSG